MINHLPPKAAIMAAVEILLSDPAALGDDTLESGLYICARSSERQISPAVAPTNRLRGGPQ
jgi:hypothetical protein